jgi:hypothetical protein
VYRQSHKKNITISSNKTSPAVVEEREGRIEDIITEMTDGSTHKMMRLLFPF